MVQHWGKIYHGTVLGETYHGTVLVLGEIYVPWHSARTGGNIHSRSDFLAHTRFGKKYIFINICLDLQTVKLAYKILKDDTIENHVYFSVNL